MKDKNTGTWRPILLTLAVLALLIAVCLGLWYWREGSKGPSSSAKPVIYLYPEEATEASVTLRYMGKLTTTYPLGEREVGGEKGTSSVSWQVIAQPDGTLIDADGNTYSYLYWEGETDTQYDLSKGFVVKGEDSADFLREKLSYMGLTPREYNEFIVYWLPRLEANAYNLITFQGKAYTDSAKLTITPEPDSLLRVFMAFKPLSKPVDIPEQELTPFTRTGFTVVEWGGCELK